MKRSRIAFSILAAGLGLPVAAQAAPFTCPQRGGDIVFGQEANVNSLDQMLSLIHI